MSSSGSTTILGIKTGEEKMLTSLPEEAYGKTPEKHPMAGRPRKDRISSPQLFERSPCGVTL